MKYTPKFFKDTIPEWKRNKDPLNCRFFIRPLSFWGSAFCANHGITANMVSYASALVAVVSCVFFLANNRTINILGAILINVWLWMDCVDGNIARSVKKEPFGEFADALSSYILVAFMCTSLGVYVYRNGGAFTDKGMAVFITIGAFASTFDTLTRLSYQKYKNAESEFIGDERLAQQEDLNTDHSKLGTFIGHIQEALGVGGWLPHFILLAVIFNVMDIVLVYCFLFYGAFFAVGMLMSIRKAVKNQREIETKSHE